MSYVFSSGFASRIIDHIEQRSILGYSIAGTKDILANFDRFCKGRFPEETNLTQEIAFAWCDDAQGNAGSKRSIVLRSFSRYLALTGEDAYTLPPMFFPMKKPGLPYICTDSELARFFEATDRFQSDCRSPLLEYTIPVIFRLQYACGLRPQEARKLRRMDVDLSGRTIYIADGKHYKDRKLPVGERVMEMCCKYDRIAEEIVPGRAHFFQSPAGSAYTPCWLSDSFSKCWEMSGNESRRRNGGRRSDCTPYSLRHRYATETLMRWLEEGRNLNAWIPYLSAYMGHASFTATYYYLRMLPERLAHMDSMRTNHIIPEAADYEEAF